MKENIICPLLSISPGDINISCLGDRCAWWVPGLENGRCAVADIATGIYSVQDAVEAMQ